MAALEAERDEPFGPAVGAAPLLASKRAIPPPPPRLVARPRLTACLRPPDLHSPRGYPRLALVVASAGSGKSSLVSEWRHQHEDTRVAWLSLEASDSEPTRFLLYLSAALETVAPEPAGRVRSLLESPQPPPFDYALTLLLKGLAELTEPVTLVLDDYHEIEAPTVHQLLTFLIEHLPPTLFLILATRRDPPLPLARLRARGEMAEIRTADLRFTLEEARQFLNESMELALAPEAVERLTDRTEGWITGLQLAALSLQRHPDPEAFLATFTGTHRYLVDYLIEQVLRRQSEMVKVFLRQTAILHRLCGPLCEAVTGIPGGQAMLEQLEAANLFLIPLDTERRWYRYHHLFADMLRARPQPSEAEPVAELHERAAIWYEAEGLIGEAIEHALAGGQVERAARLIERHFEAMWGRGEQRRLERWLKAFPVELIQTRPLLSLALAAVCNYDFRFADAEKTLNAGRFDLPDDIPASRDLRGKLLTVRGLSSGMTGSVDRSATLSRQALELLAPSSLAQSAALVSLAAACAERGELDQAAALLVEAMSAGQKCDNLVGLLRASYAYGQLRESQGALGEAERVYRSAMECARQRRLLHAAGVGLLFAGLGRLCYHRNDLPGALAHLEEALQRTRSELAGSDTPYAFVCDFELLRIQTAQGDTAAAGELLERLAAAVRAETALFFEPVVAVLRVRQPGTPAAEVEAWLAAFEAPGRGEALTALPIPGVCVPDLGSLENVIWARVRLARGRAEQVVPRLERFLERMAAEGRHGSALPVRVLLSTLYWQARRLDRAVAVLEPALTLAEREGYVRVFLDAGAGLMPVLRYCVGQGIVAEWSGQLLATWEESSPVTGVRGGRAAPVLPQPLSERELEVLRLLSHGLSNETIAAQLFLSVLTVKRHLHHIYGKLDATSRISAVTRARDLGLL